MSSATLSVPLGASPTLARAAAESTTAAVEGAPGTAQTSTGISLVAFVTALAASLIVFGVQMGFFLLLRNKLVRILCVPLLLALATDC
jgi:hypothetical protein